jgi:serine/threonine protein phosphatase PrpC
MALRVDSAGRTHQGLVREKNEDALLVDPELRLWIVCDGMGGHVGGQVASQTAVATIVEAMRSGMTAGHTPDPLAGAILLANRAVWFRAKNDPALHNMGTTVVAIRQDGQSLHLCHVGDSRIYRWSRGQMAQVTRDHSLVNLYAENPAMAARFGPANSNVIVRAVGLREEVEVDHCVMPMQLGDLYLLCSDGLIDMVDDWIVAELLSDAAHGAIDECAEALVRAALSGGGHDNVTAVVLRIVEATDH